jgi:hypothetical protein
MKNQLSLSHKDLLKVPNLSITNFVTMVKQSNRLPLSPLRKKIPLKMNLPQKTQRQTKARQSEMRKLS